MNLIATRATRPFEYRRPRRDIIITHRLGTAGPVFQRKIDRYERRKDDYLLFNIDIRASAFAASASATMVTAVRSMMFSLYFLLCAVIDAYAAHASRRMHHSPAWHRKQHEIEQTDKHDPHTHCLTRSSR